MRKKKLELSNLEIQSFVTTLTERGAHRFGGVSNIITCTAATQNCLNTDPDCTNGCPAPSGQEDESQSVFLTLAPGC